MSDAARPSRRAHDAATSRRAVAGAAFACAFAWACGPSAPAIAIGRSDPARSIVPPPADAGADAPVDPLPTFDAIAERAGVRGMREIARRDGAAEATEIARADAKDTCVRVAYAASATVTARLEDAAGAVLAEHAGTDGLLGERGPACVRRGGRVRVVFSAASPARVRFVAWAAP